MIVENIAVLNFNQNLAKRLDTCEISNVISGNKQINHKYFFTVTFLLARIQFDLRLYLVKSSLTQTIKCYVKMRVFMNVTNLYRTSFSVTQGLLVGHIE